MGIELTISDITRLFILSMKYTPLFSVDVEHSTFAATNQFLDLIYVHLNLIISKCTFYPIVSKKATKKINKYNF